MPAGSEPVPALPHTWRPFGVRVAGVFLGAALVVCFGLAWFGFDDETRAKFTAFQLGTLAFMGLLAFSVWFALVRCRMPRSTGGLNCYPPGQAGVAASYCPGRAPRGGTLDLAAGIRSRMGAGPDGARARRPSATAGWRPARDRHRTTP